MKLRGHIHNYYWHCQLAGNVSAGGFPCRNCNWNVKGNYAGDCPHTFFRIGPIEIDRKTKAELKAVFPGKNTSRQKRARILARDNHKCLLCGKTEDLTIDHITPRCRGGGGESWNLATLCWDCNQAKADNDNESLQAYRRQLIAGTVPQ